MDAIVFLIESQELRQSLKDCLRQRYEVIAATGNEPNWLSGGTDWVVVARSR